MPTRPSDAAGSASSADLESIRLVSTRLRVVHLKEGTSSLAGRWVVRRSRPDAVVAPLSGGAAGLLRRRDRIVSLLESPPPSGSLWRRQLERRQAQTSSLLVAPSRAVAVACAQRWSLDLARIRVQPPGTHLERWLEVELSRLGHRKKAWHGR